MVAFGVVADAKMTGAFGTEADDLRFSALRVGNFVWKVQRRRAAVGFRDAPNMFANNMAR